MSDDIIDVEAEGDDDGEPGSDLVPRRPIYERMAGETAKQWEAFLVYRDLGVSRSLAAVSSELGKDKRELEKWSSRWNWVGRTAAYEIDQERLDREANRQLRNRMLERQQALGAVGTSLALKRLHGHGKPDDDDYVAALDPNDLTAYETIRAAEVFAKIERSAWGETFDWVGKATRIEPAEALRIISSIVDCAMRYVPVEQHDSFVREIQAIGASQ